MQLEMPENKQIAVKPNKKNVREHCQKTLLDVAINNIDTVKMM